MHELTELIIYVIHFLYFLHAQKKQVKAANPAVPPTLLTPEGCKLRAKNQTEKARESRERRLMTHLGLKGNPHSDKTTFFDRDWNLHYVY